MDRVWKPTMSLKKMVTQSKDSGSTGLPSLSAADTYVPALAEFHMTSYLLEKMMVAIKNIQRRSICKLHHEKIYAGTAKAS